MSEKSIYDRLDDYIKLNYVEEAFDFVCDDVTDYTQDDPDDPFTIISELYPAGLSWTEIRNCWMKTNSCCHFKRLFEFHEI